ncbi:MAG: tetratricopeptide repeat protein [Bryobacteraceae bacterium]
MTDAPSGPLQVFISYAHGDEALRAELVKHLTQLRNDGLIQEWHDRQLRGGTEWAGNIDDNLNSAHIIVLLVSPDFLASRYCYDLELKRALQRHERGEARLVPVILRPCDWTSAPFGKISALPRDGKPVVDWPSQDHGFLNVVEGLRLIVDELRPSVDLRGSEKTSGQWSKRNIPRPSKRAVAITAAVAIGAITTAIQWWSSQRDCLREGEALLNIGRYTDAREPFRSALRLNPLNTIAKRGLEIAGLAQLRSDPVLFGQRLQNALNRAPQDNHLKVLLGDYLLNQGKVDEAVRQYQDSVKVNKGLAEAYFRLGVVYDKRRLYGRALEMFKQAVELGPSSPQYRNNLADAFFKHGEYGHAIEEYARIDQFPLAALESARIYRLMGKLDDAREKEMVAIEWVDNDDVMNRPENSEPWYFELDGNQGVSIPSRNQKCCYARLSLATTLYLQGDVTASEEAWNRGVHACGSQSLDIRAVLREELSRVADERDELAVKANKYRERLAAKGVLRKNPHNH